jgi:hypothetical protein
MSRMGMTAGKVRIVIADLLVNWRGLAAAIIMLAALAPAAKADDDKIKVTVVAILVSSQHTEIDKRLKDLAPELRKKDSSWTGFEVERSSAASMKIGETQSFELVDDCKTTITVKGRNENGGVSLAVKGPTIDDFAYSCCCSKFLSVVTHYDTKSKKRLVFAIMVEPCNKKK